MGIRKIMYLVLAILSIAYIAILCVDVMMDMTDWNPDFGWFAQYFDYIVRFGGVALIFCYAFCFCQGTLGVVCFIVFCVFLILYAIIMFLPDSFYNIFSGSEETTAEAIKTFLALKI